MMIMGWNECTMNLWILFSNNKLTVGELLSMWEFDEFNRFHIYCTCSRWFGILKNRSWIIWLKETCVSTTIATFWNLSIFYFKYMSQGQIYLSFFLRNSSAIVSHINECFATYVPLFTVWGNSIEIV